MEFLCFYFHGFGLQEWKYLGFLRMENIVVNAYEKDMEENIKMRSAWDVVKREVFSLAVAPVGIIVGFGLAGVSVFYNHPLAATWGLTCGVALTGAACFSARRIKKKLGKIPSPS